MLSAAVEHHNMGYLKRHLCNDDNYNTIHQCAASVMSGGTVVVMVVMVLASVLQEGFTVEANSEEYSDYGTKEDFVKFNLRSSDFAEITTTAAFVDKSMLIKTFVEDHGIVVVTAPNHYGKSTNVDMLKRFLEVEVDEDGKKLTKNTNIREPIRDTENYELFSKNKLKIAENETFMNYHFGKHPVISVDFEFDMVHVMSYDIAVEQLRYIIHRSYSDHHYLRKSERLNKEEQTLAKNWCSTRAYSTMTEDDLTDSLRVLSRLLYKHHENRRVYILMDDFDSPVLHAMLFAETEGVMGGVYRLMSTILLRVLQKNFHAHRGLITGISYIAASPAFYSLGYVTVCRFLEDHQYVGFNGLTMEEAAELLSRKDFNLTSDMKQRADLWYGGYKSCGNVTLFNTWSVLHMLMSKSVQNFQRGPGLPIKLETLLSVPVLRKEVDLLYKGLERTVKLKKIYAPDDVMRLRDLVRQPLTHKELHHSDLVLTFLLELGYLTYVPHEQPFLGKKQVKIPNREIRKEFNQIVKRYETVHAPYHAQAR